jgi:AcrR family transcriptional regulator
MNDTELTFRLSTPTFNWMATTQEARPLRADARRNRESVLKAARAVFADYGHEAQMDEIARRAAVGVGTVYRHFPTKEALLEALVVDSFARIGEAATAALERDDPWEAFAGVLWHGAELLAGNRGLTESLVGLHVEQSRKHEAVLRTAMEELIRRAKEAGALRDDMIFDDIGMLMCGVGAAQRKPHPCPESWRRHLAILLDGLRAPAATGALPD